MAGNPGVCSGCEYDYFLTVAQFYEDDCASLDFLRSHGILPLSVTCPNCYMPCKYIIDERSWLCTRFFPVSNSQKCHKSCNFSVSDSNGTLIEKIDVEPWKLLLFFNHFLSKNWDFKTINTCLEWSYETWDTWRSRCCRIARSWFEALDPIGGPGIEVEIDAILFNKLECREVISSPETWLFVAIERVSRKKIIIPLFGQVFDSESAFPIIFKYIYPGSIIYSDANPAYDTLGNYGYEHYVAKLFVDRRNPDVNIQIIHRLWRDIKESIKKCGMQPEHLEDHLFRYLFVSYPESGRKLLHRFLTEAARFYPHQTSTHQEPLNLSHLIKKEEHQRPPVLLPPIKKEEPSSCKELEPEY